MSQNFINFSLAFAVLFIILVLGVHIYHDMQSK